MRSLPFVNSVFSLRKTNEAEIGGALVEFAFSLAFLVPVLFFSVDFGRLSQNVVQFPQLGYDLTRDYARMHPGIADVVIGARFNRLFGIYEKGMQRPELTLERQPANETVKVTLSAGLIPMGSHGLDLSMTRTYVGPEQHPSRLQSHKAVFVESGCDCDPGFRCVTGAEGNDCVAYQNLPVELPAGGGSGGGCFSGETPIAMADGTQKPISLVQKGDRVLAWDEERREVVDTEVVNIMVPRKMESYYIINDHITVTGEHPFYVEGLWIKASKLRKGMLLQSQSGEKIPVFSKQIVKAPLTVYNIEVDKVHNYYAAGILVHNKMLYVRVFDAGDW